MSDKSNHRYIPSMGVYQYIGWPDAPNTNAKDIESIIKRNDHHSLKKAIDFAISHHDKDCATWSVE